MAKTKKSANLNKHLIKSCKILDSLIIDVLFYKIEMDDFIKKLDSKNRNLSIKINTDMAFDDKLGQVYQCYLQHCNNLKYYNEIVK